MRVIEALLLIPVVAGSLFYVAALVTALLFFRANQVRTAGASEAPPVTMLKPIYGLERNLERNLRSALSQDYPDYQVVLSVQRLGGPDVMPRSHPASRRCSAAWSNSTGQSGRR